MYQRRWWNKSTRCRARDGLKRMAIVMQSDRRRGGGMGDETMEKKIYCPFCGNPSLIDDNSELRKTNQALLEQLDQARSIDQEWFNDATSTINELRQRAEAAEARAAQLEAERDDWKAKAAQLHNDVMNSGAAYIAKCYTVTELQRIIDEVTSERDQLLAQAQPTKGIPIIAEITPHPDPVYGDCFQWPAQEVDQFIEMSAADNGATEFAGT